MEGGAEGTKLVFQGLRRRHRCWSSTVCLLFVAIQQMFLQLSRLPFVLLCFLLFSFIPCIVGFFFLFLTVEPLESPASLFHPFR